METTSNIMFAFPFAPQAKEKIHDIVSITFQKGNKYQKIDYVCQKRERWQLCRHSLSHCITPCLNLPKPDTTTRPLQIFWTLCQHVVNRTRHRFTVGDVSCRSASSVIIIGSIVFYRFAPIASGVENSRSRGKGIVHPKMNVLSSFNQPQVVLNLYEFHSSIEHKRRYFEEQFMIATDFHYMGKKILCKSMASVSCLFCFQHSSKYVYTLSLGYVFRLFFMF